MKKKEGFVLVALALWLVAAPLCAAAVESSQEPGGSQPAPTSDSQPLDLPSYREPEGPLPGVGVSSQIFTALGTVLGVVALGAYLYKRFAVRGLRGAGRDGTVRILSRTYLGPKESLCLVQVGHDLLLLGQTGSGITLLHTLPSDISSVSSGVDSDETPIDPADGIRQRIPATSTQERVAGLTGLEHRLKRLNKIWGTEVTE